MHIHNIQNGRHSIYCYGKYHRSTAENPCKATFHISYQFMYKHVINKIQLLSVLHSNRLEEYQFIDSAWTYRFFIFPNTFFLNFHFNLLFDIILNKNNYIHQNSTTRPQNLRCKTQRFLYYEYNILLSQILNTYLSFFVS